METAIWLKNKDNHILYSVIWVNISEKINFLQYIWNTMKTDVKPCMSQDCKKKIHVCFTEKIRVLKELQCVYFEKADPW